MYLARVAALLGASVWVIPAQVAILQIQVIEGEGAVHIPGSRSSRPITVEVTDETGRPVPNASVSFHIPEDGPGGSFPNGLRTTVTNTDSRGRAAAYGLQANRVPGRFQLVIVASREQARAGILSSQYVAVPTGPAPPVRVARSARPEGGPSPAQPQPQVRARNKWLAILLLAGGGAAAGIVAAGRAGGESAAPPAPAPPASPTIGSPSISIGKP